MNKKLVIFLTFVLLFSVFSPTAFASNQKMKVKSGADLVLYNGDVFTMDEKNNVVEAVAISGEKILAVGSNEYVKEFVGEKTKVVNLKGKTVIPGLVDSHFHLSRASGEVGRVDLNSAINF